MVKIRYEVSKPWHKGALWILTCQYGKRLVVTATTQTRPCGKRRSLVESHEVLALPFILQSCYCSAPAWSGMQVKDFPNQSTTRSNIESEPSLCCGSQTTFSALTKKRARPESKQGRLSECQAVMESWDLFLQVSEVSWLVLVRNLLPWDFEYCNDMA